MSPEGLPDEVRKALCMVDEMSNEEGQDRMDAAAHAAGLKANGDGHTRVELEPVARLEVQSSMSYLAFKASIPRWLSLCQH